MYLCVNASTYLPTYLCMHVCMRVLYWSLFLVVCASICSLSNVFSFLLQFVFFYLSVCLCWVVVRVELALNKWPEESGFYPNKGSPGHLLQHENYSTGLNTRRFFYLIWNQVGSCKSTYLSLGLSFLLPTDTCLSILCSFYRLIYPLSICTILPFLLSLYKSVYLYFLCLLSICFPPIYLTYLTYLI
jgi:hypothetical protein